MAITRRNPLYHRTTRIIGQHSLFKAKSSKITATNHLRDILPLTRYDSVVIFDLDHTLIDTDFGGELFFENICKHALKIMPDKKQAIAFALNIYCAIQEHVSFEPVEANTLKIVRMLLDINIPVIGLTARGESIVDRTLDILAHAGIHLSRIEGMTNQKLIIPDNSEAKVEYKDGVIFCSGSNKGPAAKAFFTALGITPRHSIMADDKKKHVDSVEACATSMGMDFDGIHYTHLEKKTIDMQHAIQMLKNIEDKFSVDVKAAINELQLYNLLQPVTSSSTPPKPH